jgi:hypothetical protein
MDLGRDGEVRKVVAASRAYIIKKKRGEEEDTAAPARGVRGRVESGHPSGRKRKRRFAAEAHAARCLGTDGAESCARHQVALQCRSHLQAAGECQGTDEPAQILVPFQKK